MHISLRASIPALLAASLVVACSQPPSDAPESGTDAAPAAGGARVPTPDSPSVGPAVADTLAVDGEGLRLFDRDTGSATPLAFGAAAEAVLGPLERLRGAATRGTNADCGAGPVQYANWADGLSVVLQDGRFAGWGLDERARGAVSTASGIGPGSTRAELEGAYGDFAVSETTLGQEFTAGGFAGLLDGPGPDSRITHLWAGVNCVAR